MAKPQYLSANHPAQPQPNHYVGRDSLPALVGIGVTFKRDKKVGCYVVRRVIESGPAHLHGGIEPGDVFDEVDGIPVAAKAPEELTKLVLGPAGSRVDLGIIRNGTTLLHDHYVSNALLILAITADTLASALPRF